MRLAHTRWQYALVGLCLWTVIGWTGLATACNVPVFRYALEKWDAGPHEALVFFEGTLPDASKEALAKLQAAANATPAETNLIVHTIDLEKADPQLKAIYAAQKQDVTPLVVLRFADAAQNNAAYWSGELTDANVQKILHSPARKAITQKLLKGTSAIWVFLESGDQKADDAKVKMIEDELARLQEKMHRPPILPLLVANVVGNLSVSGHAQGVFLAAGRWGHPSTELDFEELKVNPESVISPIKIAFAVHRIRRDDSQEEIFRQMLLHSESDLLDVEFRDQPMAFAVFGRGRSLYALIGAGITLENVGKDAEYLTGPCTCQVKAQNPGFDLLMTASWDGGLTDRFVKEQELPPLTGFDGFVPKVIDIDKTPTKTEPEDVVAKLEENTRSNPLDGKIPDSQTPTADPTKTNPDAKQGQSAPTESSQPVEVDEVNPAADSDADSAMLRNGLIALALAVVVVGVMFLIVRKQIPKQVG